MLKDITALENYLAEKLNCTLDSNDMEFAKTKIGRIKLVYQEIENKLKETEEKIKRKLVEMQLRVTQAETREKLNIERQRVFGESQTKVETERHKNIMVELQFMKDAGIHMLNRSSYPFYPRYNKKKHGKPDGKKPDGGRKND